MTATIESFIPKVQPSVPGCPRALIIDHLRDAMIRFCEESTIWRETLPAIDIVLDEDEHTLVPTNDTWTVTTVVNAMYNDVPIDQKTEEELDHIDYKWRTGISGTPFFYTLLAPNQFKLNRVPEASITGGLVVRVALKPLPTATTVSDTLFNDWRQQIAEGAKASLKAMSGKGWSDPAGAVTCAHNFTFGYTEARIRAQHGFGRKAISAKMRKW